MRTNWVADCSDCSDCSEWMAELAEFVSFDNGTLASCVAASNWLLLETESFTFKSSLSTDPSLSRSPSNTLLVGLDSKSKNNGSNWPVILWKLASPQSCQPHPFCDFPIWKCLVIIEIIHFPMHSMRLANWFLSLLVELTRHSRLQEDSAWFCAKMQSSCHKFTMSQCVSTRNRKKKSVKDMHQMYQNVEKKSKNKLANATIGT